MKVEDIKTMTAEQKMQAQAEGFELPPNNLPATVAEPVRQERRARAVRSAAPAEFSSKVAKAVIAVSREIGRIQKDGRNEFQRYKYTKWEDINEVLSPLLADHGLIIIQNEVNRDILERSSEGCVLALTYSFTLVHESGEHWPPVEWTAIARLTDKKGTPDDKAAVKCHTQAEKGFCLKQFKIRTDDYVDGDAHETLSRQSPKAKEIYREMEEGLDACTSAVELGAWGEENKERIGRLADNWQKELRIRYADRLEEFKKGDVEWREEDVVDPKTGEVVA